MKNIFLTLLLLPFFLLGKESGEPCESLNQWEFCVGGTFFSLYKAMDLAKTHGYSYVKILSFEVKDGPNCLSFTSFPLENDEGKVFEFEDDHCKLAVVCFEQDPKDENCINIHCYSEFFECCDDEEGDVEE